MKKENIKLNISGMTCVNCSNGIKKVTSKMKGLISSEVSFANNSGEFVVDSELLDKNKLIQKIKSLGYDVVENLHALEVNKEKAYVNLRNMFIFSFIFTAAMFYLMFRPLGDNTQTIVFVLATFVQFVAGGRFYVLSYQALSHRNYDMNVLVALGTSAAYFYSAFVVLFSELIPENMRFVYFDGASVIITFVLLGRLLEERSRARASDFLKNLMDLSPVNANLIQEDGSIKEIAAKDLQIKDRVLIKQGEKISTDALIIEGNAQIDASMITGESLAVYKEEGDEIIAGTINIQGTLKVEVLKRSTDTQLSKIIELLAKAQSKQMPIARFADKVANIFVPIVILISLSTFILWYFFVGDTLSAILASISVLIISCPCALGLATPIAIVSSVAKGAKEGILIKNPEVLEIIKDIHYAVFDKTGTLTKGEISIKEILIDKGHIEDIASIELLSEHPISKAIVKYAKNNNVEMNKVVEDLKTISGMGMGASIEGKEIFIGNMPLMKKHEVMIPKDKEDFYNETLTKGNGVILLSVDKICIGVISLEDKLKEGAIELIASLKKRNIKAVLLTGDNEITAKSVAGILGIEEVYAQVLPNEKYEIIKKLQKKSKVMFIGDGLNDSISIKQADIGVTLNSGSDITKDAGDIILMNNDIKMVEKSIDLSFKTMRIIKQNLFWAFFYNALGIPLAAGVLYPFFGILLSPMYAGMAMSFSSVIVVLNSLRLKLS
ncbi:MAG: copper-translocating P-type ATPase [Arcobacter sp.]|nr:MAG: copper-translocating P-type ATPase [Arcobacter sp.]